MAKRKFKRQQWWKHKRLGEKWRKPRGSDSKMRRGIRGRPSKVKVGFRSPSKTRGRHPSGLLEVLVHNLRELERVDSETQAARIASGVGRNLRERIVARARERKVKVLNPGKTKVVVREVHEVEKLDPATQAVRIAADVGKSVRKEIVERAKERRVTVLRPVKSR